LKIQKLRILPFEDKFAEFAFFEKRCRDIIRDYPEKYYMFEDCKKQHLNG
jgi:hypothetical protein